MNIKHLVLSGGSYHGLLQLGALYQAEETLLKFSNIESVYGTSAGAISLTMWLLRIEKKDLYEFIIDKPWEKTFAFESNIITNLVTKKGICGENIINEILFPLLKSKYLSTDITLKKFFEVTQVDFHIIASNINTMEPVDFSHTTHPELPLVNALYMSASIPFLFQPMYHDNSYIVDGGLTEHFPIKSCLESGAKKDNILGIIIKKDKPFQSTENTPLHNYMIQILFNISCRLSNLVMVEIPYIIRMNLENNNDDLKNVITSKETRRQFLERGEQFLDDFLQSGVEELVK